MREGFLGQRVRVLPRPLIRELREKPIVRRFLVTDVGYFPHAAAHGRARAHGAPETVVILCAAGVGWIEVDGGPATRVAAGDAAVLAAGVRHRYRADSQDPWTIWWMHVTGDDADDFASSILANNGGPIVRVHDVYSAVQSMEEAVSALEEDDTMPKLLAACGAGWRFLTHVAASRILGATASNDRIRHVQDYLRNNLDTEFSVPELAAMAGLSASHFSTLFRASAGASIKEYLKRLRSARARELLLTTDLPVTQIAAAVGYDDALYFSRQFRAVNGISPSGFREQHEDEETATRTS
ncbi:helix-turn-helix domain-containing protein [Lacisediminihabitans changchengi]|uniref:Helix-turn-helix domain-containing protein n=1 Tax=Lacisediminihabitans changchengi TaxID=2787634 RepID=A0A934W370_9MICO|nr:AraC family transcriptional regulator [Lacisediminihabitans changchengi]MBK4348648.1 helix-turn-helix domain-containing protein [Lacisediminihabitans changchengi]